MKQTIVWRFAPFCLAAAMAMAAPAVARGSARHIRPQNSSSGSGGSGQQLFTQNCASCHGADGQGRSGPRLSGKSLGLDQIQKQVTNGGTQMPSFGKRLSPAEVHAVSTYVRSLGSRS